jgi:hypothetical protein
MIAKYRITNLVLEVLRENGTTQILQDTNPTNPAQTPWTSEQEIEDYLRNILGPTSGFDSFERVI